MHYHIFWEGYILSLCFVIENKVMKKDRVHIENKYTNNTDIENLSVPDRAEDIKNDITNGT